MESCPKGRPSHNQFIKQSDGTERDPLSSYAVDTQRGKCTHKEQNDVIDILLGKKKLDHLGPTKKIQKEDSLPKSLYHHRQ